VGLYGGQRRRTTEHSSDIYIYPAILLHISTEKNTLGRQNLNSAVENQNLKTLHKMQIRLKGPPRIYIYISDSIDQLPWLALLTNPCL
jgi:hypothetical protein